MLGCCFPLGVFGVLGSPSPSRGEGPGAPRIPNWEKLEYSYTIEIILYNFLIISYKNLLKKKLENIHDLSLKNWLFSIVDYF